MPPKRKHQQAAAETEPKAAAPEDQQQAEGTGVKEEDEQQEAKVSEEKAKEEEEGVGQAASSPKKEDEEEEEQDAPELKRRKVSFQEPQKEKEEEKGGGEVVAENLQEGEAQRFEFAWDHFTGLLEGDGAGFTGAEPNVSVCDEPVDEALVRAGLELLNAATGPWHEDADEGRRRTKQVAASGSDYGDSVARVYRASSPSAEPLSETDRFELTFLQCPGFAAHFECVSCSVCVCVVFPSACRAVCAVN
jgi:hypothetical protein